MPGAASSNKGADRRASVRYPCDPDSFSADNSCRPVTAPKKESWSAVVRDVSTGGIGIVINRRFEPGTLLTVDLEDAERTARRSLLVRVMRITQENSSAWMHGCAFTHKMSESELLDLM
jgi:hypothetical protein